MTKKWIQCFDKCLFSLCVWLNYSKMPEQTTHERGQRGRDWLWKWGGPGQGRAPGERQDNYNWTTFKKRTLIVDTSINNKCCFLKKKKCPIKMKKYIISKLVWTFLTSMKRKILTEFTRPIISMTLFVTIMLSEPKKSYWKRELILNLNTNLQCSMSEIYSPSTLRDLRLLWD